MIFPPEIQEKEFCSFNALVEFLSVLEQQERRVFNPLPLLLMQLAQYEEYGRIYEYQDFLSRNNLFPVSLFGAGSTALVVRKSGESPIIRIPISSFEKYGRPRTSLMFQPYRTERFNPGNPEYRMFYEWMDPVPPDRMFDLPLSSEQHKKLADLFIGAVLRGYRHQDVMHQGNTMETQEGIPLFLDPETVIPTGEVFQKILYIPDTAACIKHHMSDEIINFLLDDTRKEVVPAYLRAEYRQSLISLLQASRRGSEERFLAQILIGGTGALCTMGSLQLLFGIDDDEIHRFTNILENYTPNPEYDRVWDAPVMKLPIRHPVSHHSPLKLAL